jgi:predicted aldo/keto reductase-like oxidoreductase
VIRILNIQIIVEPKDDGELTATPHEIAQHVRDILQDVTKHHEVINWRTGSVVGRPTITYIDSSH